MSEILKISQGPIELHRTPYAKAAIYRSGVKENDSFCPSYPHLFLSSILHSALQGNLNPNSPSMAYLNEMGLGETITHVYHTIGNEIKEQFEERTGIPYRDVSWINEMRFQTTPNQVRLVETLTAPERISPEIQNELKERTQLNGYSDIPSFIRDLLKQPDKKIRIDNKDYTQSQILHYYRIIVKNISKQQKNGKTTEPVYSPLDQTEEDDSESRSFIQKTFTTTPDQRFALLVASLLSYNYYSFEGLDRANDLEKKNKIGSLTARPDQVGFLPLTNKQANQTIIDDAKLAFSHHLNNKCMLYPDDLAHIYKLIEAIKKGEIALFVHEIKTEMFATKMNSEGEIVESTFDPKEIKQKHYKDISHTLSAMFLGLQNIVMHPDYPGKKDTKFVDLMSENYQTRVGALRGILRDYKNLYGSSSRTILSKIYYPIIDTVQDEEGEVEYRINRNLANSVKPITSSLIIPQNALLKETVRKAENLFREVQTYGGQIITPSLAEILT